MEIVPYDANDSQKVAGLFREIFAELGWTERPSDYMDQPHLLFHLPDQGRLLVAKNKGQIVATAGFILLNKDQALVKRVYLKRQYRGGGLAQKLLQELIVQAQSMGIKELILDVSKNNSRALHFWRKSGFLETEITPFEGWPESHQPQKHLYFHKFI